jgi:nucleotide-binding universal stress UspA family protein
MGTDTAADVDAAVARHRQALLVHSGEFASRVLGDGDAVETVVLDSNFIAESIVRYAEEHEVDWICIGATGHRALGRLILGDVVAEVLHRTHLPVLTTRADQTNEFDHILVAVDLSDRSKELIDAAVTLGSRLTLLHVVEGAEARGLYRVPLEVPVENMNAVLEWCDVALRQLAEKAGATAEPRVIVGRPGASILAVEEELRPDVTVVGTHGRHGVERLLLGSVAERVARHATGPVLVVPNRPA